MRYVVGNENRERSAWFFFLIYPFRPFGAREMAGDNSLSAYVRSVVRNADFRDMRPRLRQALGGDDEEQRDGRDTRPRGGSVGQSTEGRRTSERAPDEASPLLPSSKPTTDHNEIVIPLQHTLSSTAQTRVHQLAQQRDETRSRLKDSEREPLYTNTVHHPDGTTAEVIVGESTLPQTIFNSANVLIGVGLLSLPLAFRYSGWVLGFLGLIVSAFVTRYTAGLLAKCLDVDSSLANFADIAFVAFGETGRATTSCVITLELMTACVGLVILFADSLGALIDGLDDAHWKVVCGLVLLPLTFLPMRWLSFTSALGIFCSLGIIGIALGAGVVTGHAPGSLRDMATTTAWPEHWAALPLSIGLIMGE